MPSIAGVLLAAGESRRFGGRKLLHALPGGGTIGKRSAAALAAAVAASRVALTPGPVFSPGGGLDTFVRLPWTRPEAELRDAVERIAAAWHRLEADGQQTGVSRTRARAVF